MLPRELSLKEIKYLCENSPLELEMFVHGALCMSVSGQCLMSAMLGSRSGNRGLCAQPCRLPFKVQNGTGNDLSLKDLSLVEQIKTLSELGVSSFKIEGRMKRPEYVAAAVKACRDSLENSLTSDGERELENLFSRQGFTQGYFDNKLGRDMFGTRKKENVTSATNELLKKYAKLYEKEIPSNKADFYFTAALGEKPTLSAKSGKHSVFIEGENTVEKAINRSLDFDTVQKQLLKCGGTAFYAGEIEADIDEGVSVPVSSINSMRREVLSQLEKLTENANNYKINDYKREFTKENLHTKKETYLFFYDAEKIPENVRADKIFVPLDSEPELIKKYHADVILPRGVFFNSKVIEDKLKTVECEYAVCHTLDSLAIAKNAGKKVIGSAHMNVFNSLTLNEQKNLGVEKSILSYELTLPQIASLKSNQERGLVVYGKTPLMLTRNCPVKNGKTCKECGRKSFITDRKGINFPVLCTNGFSEIFNSRPTYMFDRMSEIKNIDFDVLIFTNESKQEIKNILSAYQKKLAPQGEFTRGLYYRGVE